MRESTLKRGLDSALEEAMPGAVVFRHEDKFTGGIPDLSVTWNGRTAWVEVKVGSEPVTQLQEWQLRRIARAGAHALVFRYCENPVASVLSVYLRGSSEPFAAFQYTGSAAATCREVAAAIARRLA